MGDLEKARGQIALDEKGLGGDREKGKGKNVGDAGPEREGRWVRRKLRQQPC